MHFIYNAYWAYYCLRSDVRIIVRVKAHAASGRGCERGAFGGAATDEGRWSYLVSWTRPTRADHGVSGALRVALVLSFSRCRIARTHGS